MNPDTQQIVEVLKSYEKHVNNSDGQNTGDLYTDNGILFPDRMATFEGKENITGFYQYAFSMLTLELSFDIDPEKISIEGDTAYATTTSTGTRFIKEMNQTVPEINRELWVFNKLNGDWKIACYCFNKTE